MMNENMGGACGCGCHKVLPILVVLFGLTFLLAAFGVFTASTVAWIWPVLVILAGLKKLTAGMCKCCK